MTYRTLKSVEKNNHPHWVGNGFHVRSLFSPSIRANENDPFLLCDYAAPMKFSPNEKHPRGVGAHPHKGFETVTIAYKGEVAHRDSSGGGGVIQEGDVQWMTAGRGIIHEEFHSENFSKTGGDFEMMQLWVNLPKKDKLTPAKYQHLAADAIEVAPLQNANSETVGSIRLIAGEYDGKTGAASTFSPVNVFDVDLKSGADVEIKVPNNHRILLVNMRGVTQVNGSDESLEVGELARFSDPTEDNGQSAIRLQATGDVKLLMLTGEPLNEPVVSYGPFVMNTPEEIQQSIHEFQTGQFGHL